MFTFKMITLSQDLYWNSKQNEFIRRKLFKMDLNWFMSCLFYASRMVIKNFNSKIKGTFLESC